MLTAALVHLRTCKGRNRYKDCQHAPQSSSPISMDSVLQRRHPQGSSGVGGVEALGGIQRPTLQHGVGASSPALPSTAASQHDHGDCSFGAFGACKGSSSYGGRGGPQHSRLHSAGHQAGVPHTHLPGTQHHARDFKKGESAK